MKKWTSDELIAQGYKIENCTITDVLLSMEDHGCLTLNLVLQGHYWSCSYGGYCLGSGYLGASDDYWKGSPNGIEVIMRIMDVIGVSELTKLKDKHARVATKGGSAPIKIIGNIIEDKWFDYETFFEDKKKEAKE